MTDEVVCKYCQSPNVRKYGRYGEAQYYYCNDCKRKFTPNASLFGMKTPANQVSSALDMYYKGLSLNEFESIFNPSTRIPLPIQRYSSG